MAFGDRCLAKLKIEKTLSLSRGINSSWRMLPKSPSEINQPSIQRIGSYSMKSFTPTEKSMSLSVIAFEKRRFR